MSWFQHRHHWRVKTGLVAVKADSAALPHSHMYVEDCACGAVRSIEFAAGRAPEVRIAITPTTSTISRVAGS